MAKQRVPNMIELGRRPDPLRYVWTAVAENGDIHTGSTWGSLNRVMGDKKIDVLYVSDLIGKKVHEFSGAKIDKFMDLWRRNYFDPAYYLKGI